MIIRVDRGISQYPPTGWWVGRTYECLGCNSLIQMERTDEGESVFAEDAQLLITPYLRWTCPVCGDFNTSTGLGKKGV